MNNLLKHKGRMKLGILMIAIIILFQGTTFANTDDMNLLGEAAHFIVSFASWGWVIFAILAGKLMTNDFVYGSFMHLDIYLRKLWNVMKNFANFAIGFAFLYSILRSIFVTKKNGKNIVVKFLLAGILVQASWFLIGAVMDLSTIATTAISAFPAQFMAGDNAFLGNMKDKYANLYGKKMIFNSEGEKDKPVFEVVTTKQPEDVTEDEIKQVTDIILPNYRTVSGPLLFLGFSIFDFSSFPNPDKLKGQTDTNFAGLLVYLGINGLVVILFTVALFILFIINLVRVGMLRVLIPLSPFIVLASLFKEQIKLGGSLDKWFNIKTIVTLLFKPVIYVAYLSLIFIFTVGVFAVLKPNDTKSTVEFTDQNVTVSSNQDVSSFEVEGLVDFTLKGAKNTISGIIVYLFALFLMRYLIKLAAKTGTGIASIDKNLEKITGGVESIAGNLPVVPIPTGKGMEMVGTGAAKDAREKLSSPAFAVSNKEEQKRQIEAMFGGGGVDWDASVHGTKLQTGINSFSSDANAFWNATNQVAGEVKGGIGISDGQWSEKLKEWLKRASGKTIKSPDGKVDETWPAYDGTQDLEKYFKNPRAVELLKNRLGGLTTSTNINADYTNLGSVTFGKYSKVTNE